MKFFFSRDLMCKFIGFSLLLFIISSCTRLDTTSLGGNLLPGSDSLNTDTLAIPVTTTSFIDNDTSVIEKTEQHVIGYVNDPLFGTTTAAAYIQFLPSTYPLYPKVKDSLELDSVVLSVRFTGTYGDTNAITKVNVYQINDTAFKKDKRYTADKGFKLNESFLIGTKSFKATDLRKSYQIARKKDTFSVTNQLRIKLDQTWGRLLLDQKIDTASGAGVPDSIFRVFLNGLAVVPDSTTSGNAIHYFSLVDTATKVNIYYRVRRATPVTPADYDTVSSILVFAGNPPGSAKISASGNKIFRNYNGSIAQPHITSGSPSSLAYLLTAPGTSVRIKAPTLNSIVGKTYIVHRAELVMRQIYQGPATIENILLQPTLHLFTIDANGKNAPIPVDSASYLTRFFGFDQIRNVVTYDITNSGTENYLSTFPYFTTIAGNRVAEYRLNITRYVQNIINGKTTLRDFKLEAPYFANFTTLAGLTVNTSSSASINPIAYGRVQVGGGSHPLYPMYVRIYYSKQ